MIHFTFCRFHTVDRPKVDDLVAVHYKPMHPRRHDTGWMDHDRRAL